MRIILFRHGPAGERNPVLWPDDSLRPLSPRGEERTRRAAQGLVRIEPGIRLVLTSPLERAAATARILQEALDGGRVEELEALKPEGSQRKLMEFLGTRRSDLTVALVGHEPDLGQLAGALVFGSGVAIPLKKAGACAIQFVGQVRPGEGRLAWLNSPRVLRRFAGKKKRV